MNRMINTNARGQVQDRLPLAASSYPACVQAAIALIEARTKATRLMSVTKTEALGDNAALLTIRQEGNYWPISIGFRNCNVKLLPYWFDDSDPNNIEVKNYTDLTLAFISALAQAKCGNASNLVYSTDPRQMAQIAVA